MFSGIVYSQCLRLRRIINSYDRLKLRICELKEAFKTAGYPGKMIDNISKKVMNMNRDISEKPKQASDPSISQPIRIISTYGADNELTDSVLSAKEDLLLTRSFSNFKMPLITFVKKTATSIKSRVSTLKDLALGNKFGKIISCNGPGCKSCTMLGNESEFKVNGEKVITAPGTCKSYNVIYIAKCRICSKYYTGRTTDYLHIRNNNHRSKFYDIINGKVNLSSMEDDDDSFSLGVHLYVDHALHNFKDYDENYTFALLENCSPSRLEVKEHIWIHRLQTLHPKGLNRMNPFAIPLL